MPDQPDELRSFTIFFRSSAALVLASGVYDNSAAYRDMPTYQATPDVVQQIAQDFATGKKSGVYPIVHRSQARTLALRFEDVLRID